MGKGTEGNNGARAIIQSRGAPSYLQDLQFPPKLYKRVGQGLLSQNFYRQGRRRTLEQNRVGLRPWRGEREAFEMNFPRAPWG